MGLYSPKNPASTGTMTRIVEKASKAISIGAMEQTKASKNNIFYKYVYF